MVPIEDASWMDQLWPGSHGPPASALRVVLSSSPGPQVLPRRSPSRFAASKFFVIRWVIVITPGWVGSANRREVLVCCAAFVVGLSETASMVLMPHD